MSQTIDSQDGDKQYLEEYKHEVEMVTGVIIEMLTTERTTLLSPIFREILLERALRLKHMHGNIGIMLCVDNPGRSLRERDK